MKPSHSIAKTCAHCGSAFKGRRHQRFCSKACILRARLPAMLARAATPEAKAKKAESLTRSSAGKGYLKRNLRHVHRTIAEKMLGRPLASGEIVHHVDGNKRNNDPLNLRVMTQGEHMREHGLGIPGMTLPWKPWTKRGRKSQ